MININASLLALFIFSIINTEVNLIKNYNKKRELADYTEDRLNTCSNFNDCFNCTTYIDEYVDCYWSKGKCVTIEQEKKSWWLYYDQCLTDTEATKTMENYCGPSKHSVPLVLALNKINNNWGTRNLYCNWQVLDFENGNISVNFTNYIVNDISSSMVMEVNYEGGQKQYQTINLEVFNMIITHKISSIYFHYFTAKSFTVKPFVLSMTYESGYVINYIGLFVSVTVVIFICIWSAIMFYKCSKRNFERRNQILADQINPHRINVAPNENGDHIAKKNLNIFEKLLQTELKPVNYDQKVNIYSTNCTICLEDFNENSKVIILECKHIFDFQCLNDWLIKNILNPKCPNCNYIVLKEKEEEGSNNAMTVLHLNNNRGNLNNNVVFDEEINNLNNFTTTNVNNLNNNPSVINFEIQNNNPNTSIHAARSTNNNFMGN